MLMDTKRFITFLTAAFLCLSAGAQFYTTGDDPGRLKWYSIQSDNFNILYPEGLDSLARVYGSQLEQYRTPVGASIGFKPNEFYRRPIPVILHSYKADANGLVTWSPHRMELYTGPDARRPDVLQWEANLAMHESRHVAQMQSGRMPGFGLFNWLGGDLFGGAMAGLYAGQALFEGDAVAMETALSTSGRGRSADFLEYYRVSFDAGDFRNWYQWRYGSQKKYTPSYYAAGYMLVGGMRYNYDDALFAEKFYRNIRSRQKFFYPLPLFNTQYTVKDISGKKLREAWQEISRTQNAIWKADEQARGPFTEPVQFTPDTRRYTEYLSPTAVGQSIIAVRHGLTSTARLVKIDSLGRTEVLRPFAETTDDIQYSEPLGRLFWSETVPDIRWSMASSSRIRSADADGRNVTTLTREGRYFNPAPSPAGRRIAVTEYPIAGGTAVTIIDGLDGHQLERYPAPDSLQVVETAWLKDGRIAASAISPSGFGIYSVTDGYSVLLEPQTAKIKQLRSTDGELYFVSDRTGVNELYTLASGGVRQLSNNRFGASEFLVGRDSLTFAALRPDGRQFYRSAPEPKTVDYSDLYHHPVADKLSAQEASLCPPSGWETSSFSEPQRYRKLPHLMRFHSWLPLFVDYDDVSNISFETLTTYGILGATAFFQNHLNTAYGMLGYSLDKQDGKWRHGAHAKFTYTGLFPVFELSANLQTTSRSVYGSRFLFITPQRYSLSLVQDEVPGPSFNGSAKVYVPLNFSSGGWTRGIIPQTTLSFSNNALQTARITTRMVEVVGREKNGYTSFLIGSEKGSLVPLTRFSAGLRAYTMLNTAKSGIYPRWGIGMEAGYGSRPLDRGLFTPNIYSFVYGYIPGFLDTHGVKLSATTQFQLDGHMPENYVKVLPRGIISSGIQSYITRRFPVQSNFTIDYALPFLPLDCAWLGPLAYIKNLELNVHADLALYGGSDIFQKGNLFSAGAQLCARLANFLWLPFDGRAGVAYSYSGGSLWERMAADKIEMESRHSISLVFTVDL